MRKRASVLEVTGSKTLQVRGRIDIGVNAAVVDGDLGDSLGVALEQPPRPGVAAQPAQLAEQIRWPQDRAAFSDISRAIIS